MHVTDELRDVYTHGGPFATVYLDASRDSEKAPHELTLRWRSVRGELAAKGADEPTLTALEAALLERVDAPGRHGRILVGTEGSVVLDRPLPQPPATPVADWAPLPDVMPYVAAMSTEVPRVVVVADRTGADLDIVPGSGVLHETIEGDDQHPIHKTRRNQWNERHFQNRVDNAWEENAREVAEVVVRHVREIKALLVLLAGDERAVALLRHDLDALLPPGVAVAVVEAGGRAPGASEEALEHALRDEVLKFGWRRRRELLEHLSQNLGRGEFAASGVTQVLDAVRKAQVDTVVLSDDRSSTLTAWIGPDPLQVGTSPDELQAMGVDDPQQVRFDAALTRAVVGSGADLEVTPNAHNFLHEGIAALLRFQDAATPSPQG